MRRSFLVALAAGAAMLLTNAGLYAQSAAPPPDPNFKLTTEAAVQLQAMQFQVAVAKAASMAASMEHCAQFKSELAQVMCAGFVTGAIGQSSLAPAGAMAVSLPAPPQPRAPPPDLWTTIINAPAVFFEAAKQLAPTVAQYLLGRHQTKSNEVIALAGSAERQALYGVFERNQTSAVSAVAGAAGVGFNAVRDVANQGFITIGALPQGQTWNITGSHGLNFGPGALTYNPVTASYNPVNPAPLVCTGTATGVSCN